MESDDAKAPDIHPAALLLPWYVNGTLGSSEKHEVEIHLAGCASCRAELLATQRTSTQIREAVADKFVPDTWNIARSRIGTSASLGGGWTNGLAQWMRNLFALQWVPAAALTLLVVQSGALMWMSQRATQTVEISTRGLASPSTRLTIVFQPGAVEQDLRRLLLEIRAHVVAGPTADGAYSVEVATTDAVRVEQKLATLRAHGELVRSAERTNP